MGTETFQYSGGFLFLLMAAEVVIVPAPRA